MLAVQERPRIAQKEPLGQSARNQNKPLIDAGFRR